MDNFNAADAKAATTASILAFWRLRKLRLVAYFFCVHCVRCVEAENNEKTRGS